MSVRFALVLVLCLRVLNSRSTNGIDLPELESIRMGDSALTYEEFEDITSTLIMRSDKVNGK